MGSHLLFKFISAINDSSMISLLGLRAQQHILRFPKHHCRTYITCSSSLEDLSRISDLVSLLANQLNPRFVHDIQLNWEVKVVRIT